MEMVKFPERDLLLLTWVLPRDRMFTIRIRLSATDGIVDHHRGTESENADRLGAISLLWAICALFYLEVLL